MKKLSILSVALIATIPAWSQQVQQQKPGEAMGNTKVNTDFTKYKTFTWAKSDPTAVGDNGYDIYYYEITPDRTGEMDRSDINRNQNKTYGNDNNRTSSQDKSLDRERTDRTYNSGNTTDQNKTYDKSRTSDQSKTYDKNKSTSDQNKAYDKSSTTDRNRTSSDRATDKSYSQTDRNRTSDETQTSDLNRNSDQTRTTDPNRTSDQTRTSDQYNQNKSTDQNKNSDLNRTSDQTRTSDQSRTTDQYNQNKSTDQTTTSDQYRTTDPNRTSDQSQTFDKSSTQSQSNDMNNTRTDSYGNKPAGYVYSYTMIIPARDSQANEAIKDGIENELEGRGYREAGEGSDLIVAYQVLDRKATLHGFSNDNMTEASGEQVRQPSDTATFALEPGTLMVSLIDAKTSQMIWHGWSSGMVENSAFTTDQADLKEAVHEIFEKFNHTADKAKK